jgi:hypothetical protein
MLAGGMGGTPSRLRRRPSLVGGADAVAMTTGSGQRATTAGNRAAGCKIAWSGDSGSGVQDNGMQGRGKRGARCDLAAGGGQLA